MNVTLKVEIIRNFGSQARASKPLQIDESRLSRIVQGHREPTPAERERFKSALGIDCFSDETEGPRVA